MGLNLLTVIFTALSPLLIVAAVAAIFLFH